MRPHHFHFQAPKDARSNLGGPPSEYKQGAAEEGPIYVGIYMEFRPFAHGLDVTRIQAFLKPSNGRKYFP